MRYALKVAYDGSSYSGWQIQNNAVTVQQTLCDAAREAFKREVKITASGRTDAGVHAAGQVCHLDADLIMPGERVADAINAHLPDDIKVTASAAAPEGFDANRSAKRKTYEYRLYFSQRRNPLLDRYACFVKGVPCVEKMREAAALFVGEHDFKAYCASGSQVLTTVRTVYSADIRQSEEYGCKKIAVSVCGNGFLYNMVRTIVGTVLYYSVGRLTLEDIRRSLEERDRARAGKTMPPNGLILMDVDYGISLFGE